MYGKETLKQVDVDSETIAEALNASAQIPITIVSKPVVITPTEIYDIADYSRYGEAVEIEIMKK